MRVILLRRSLADVVSGHLWAESIAVLIECWRIPRDEVYEHMFSHVCRHVKGFSRGCSDRMF